MLSKRLKILHTYEKGLHNCFDLKTGAISSLCLEIYPKNRQKGVMSIFSKTVFVAETCIGYPKRKIPDPTRLKPEIWSGSGVKTNFVRVRI